VRKKDRILSLGLLEIVIEGDVTLGGVGLEVRD